MDTNVINFIAKRDGSYKDACFEVMMYWTKQLADCIDINTVCVINGEFFSSFSDRTGYLSTPRLY